MLKVNFYVVPSDAQWHMAIKGMRNPMNSWSRMDSDGSHLGEIDEDLMLRLARLGTEHRKYLRMLPVIVDMTAPQYFIAELDTYKLGTVKNSSSLQHKGASRPFTIRDFSVFDDRIYDVLDPIKVKAEHKLVYSDDGNSEYKEYVCGDRAYRVFRNGRIESCDFSRNIDAYGSVRHYKGRELIPTQNPAGYYCVNLGGRMFTEKWLLHRLVAFVWHRDSYFDGADVNHIDGNKGNNSADNLEWCTHQENEKHKHANGLSGRTLHTDYESWKSSSRVDYIAKRRIKELYASGKKQDEIAESFGVSQSCVSAIIRDAGSENGLLFIKSRWWETIIDGINSMRDKYVETGDEEYFMAMRSLIPMGYNYTFTWSANYEVLASIYRQRKNHKMPEWQTFRKWIEKLPNSYLITEGVWS